MKHKRTLVLLELLIMTAVFALAAALCLQAFAEADRISRDTLRRDRAAVLCENAAGMIQSAGSAAAAADALGAEGSQGCWQLSLEEGGEAFLLEIQEQAAPVPGMGAAQVRVLCSSDEAPLFCLTVGYQEAVP